MKLDLSKMEPVECPDCHQQLFITRVPDEPGRAKFGGCRCERKVYDIPDSVAFGIGEAPMFLYKKQSS